MNFDCLFLTYGNVHVKWVALHCLCVFAFSPQCLFSQTTGLRPDLDTRIEQSKDNSNSLARQGVPLPKATHPFASLTVVVENGQALDDNLSKHVPSACYENTFQLFFFLRADGTMCRHRHYPLQVQIVSPESVTKSIEAGATMKDNCLLKLRTDGDVDFNTVTKMIQSLQGVEKRFDRFQLFYCFYRAEEQRSLLRNFCVTAKVFFIHHQRFPKSLSELRDKYPDVSSFTDKWGKEVSYIVSNNGLGCYFTSNGKDRIFNTEDDLTERVEENWSDRILRELRGQE